MSGWEGGVAGPRGAWGEANGWLRSWMSDGCWVEVPGGIEAVRAPGRSFGAGLKSRDFVPRLGREGGGLAAWRLGTTRLHARCRYLWAGWEQSECIDLNG